MAQKSLEICINCDDTTHVILFLSSNLMIDKYYIYLFILNMVCFIGNVKAHYI